MKFLNMQAITLTLLFVSSAFSQNDVKKAIRGQVTDAGGRPLPYVNLFLKESFDGDVSDSTGVFEIVTHRDGEQILVASMIGYEQAELRIDLAQLPETITVKMREQAVAMPEATITASSFSSGDDKGVTLKRMDIVTTPGASADILFAMKTFPGLSHIDEGSGLFVRGGDVSETITILDQATVVHPYRYESPTGGTFGTITPFLVSGTFFSTGGFGAKYGNALSGILAMESLEHTQQHEYNFNVGLASTSARLALPINDKLSLRFSGNRSATGLMFRLNGREDEFTLHPRGTDVNLSLNLQTSKSGRLKLFAFLAETRLGVKIDQPSFDGVYNSDDLNQLYNLQWTQLLAKNWLLQTSLSMNHYSTDRDLGLFQLEQRDQTIKLRADSEKEFNKKSKLNFGAERELIRSRFLGQFPESDVLDPNAEATTIDAAYDAERTGLYAESEVELQRGLFLKTGLRADHHTLAQQWVFDPRGSLFYQLDATSTLRLSAGLYHQFPEPLLFAPGYGNPDLKAQQAVHAILGYEYQDDATQFRAEIYHKEYDDLVIENDDLEFTNRGHGYARGLDLFFKHGVLFQDRINGWISYSFLHSKRLQTRETPDGLTEEFASSSFDITHNLSAVAKFTIVPRVSAGLTYRFATGRPITPVLSAEKHPEFNFYVPYEGALNSERLPGFHRLDMSISYLQPLGQSDYAIFYLAVSNLLNRNNVLDYDYSMDYSQRFERTTNYSRFVYFGITTTFRN